MGLEEYAQRPLQMRFLPIGRVIVDPLLLEEATTRAVYRRETVDWPTYMNDETGEIRIGLPSGIDKDPATIIQMHVIGTVHIRKALQEDRLRAYTLDSAGNYLRIPRFYWLQQSVIDGGTIAQIETIDQSLSGCPILVDPNDLPAWDAVAQEAIIKVLAAISAENDTPLPAIPGLDHVTSQEIHAKISKVTTENRCADWLREVYSKKKVGLPSKGKAWAMAQIKWPDDLSHRGFLRVWGDVSNDFSWMSTAGRKKGAAGN